MKKVIFLTFAILLAITTITFGQLRIGSAENPHESAILDLTNPSNLGLKLPVVNLQDAEILQVGGSTADEDLSAVGMLVYNTNVAALDGEGVYLWDGYCWNALNTQGKTGEKFTSGLIVATCNVGAPGTFAENPGDIGMYYQWNSKVAWDWNGTEAVPLDGTSVWNDAWDGNGATKWAPENDPCPAGWRMPTYAEILLFVQSITDFNFHTDANGKYVEIVTFNNGATIIISAEGGLITSVNQKDYVGGGPILHSTTYPLAWGLEHPVCTSFDDGQASPPCSPNYARQIRCLKDVLLPI
ncbi:hypothetical protein FACS189413_10260 [Bacteroidia bacterium]|nr:hypothetical protein FACS189413_10260 [Bacteroidia bacterium]